MPTHESMWRRVVRALSNFAEALDATEASLLEKRVWRLECDVAELKLRDGRHPSRGTSEAKAGGIRWGKDAASGQTWF